MAIKAQSNLAPPSIDFNLKQMTERNKVGKEEIKKGEKRRKKERKSKSEKES